MNNDPLPQLPPPPLKGDKVHFNFSPLSFYKYNGPSTLSNIHPKDIGGIVIIGLDRARGKKDHSVSRLIKKCMNPECDRPAVEGKSHCSVECYREDMRNRKKK